MKYLIVTVLLIAGFIGCSEESNVVKLKSGLQYVNDSLGTGSEAKSGDLITIHFRAWVIKDSTNVFADWNQDSTRMTSLIGNSIDFGQPIKIKLGASAFIRGADEAIVGMKVGGWRTILIPSGKAYGELGYGPIPPNSSLKVVINLLDTKEPLVAKQWDIDSTKIDTTKSGLRYCIIIPGSPDRADSTDLVTVHYSGFLTSGRIFDSSVERDEPFKFRFKLQPMIPGWEEGIKLIGKGGKIKLIIPPSLAYGEVPEETIPTDSTETEPADSTQTIPANSTLIFDVEMLDIQKMNMAQK